jgi:hypothetical protein
MLVDGGKGRMATPTGKSKALSSTIRLVNFPERFSSNSRANDLKRSLTRILKKMSWN